MAGPWIGRMLAACGAEVIRVESVQRPDVVRLYVPPRDPERRTEPTMSPWFTDWNAGKRFVGLDLTRSEAVALSKRLVARCDVVIENYTAGVIDKLGLGYDVLRELRPDLVMLSSSGYGETGPCSRYVTWGPNIETLSGMGTLSGFPERPCTMTQFAYPDALSALHGLFGVLAALDYRRLSGEGQHVTLSQFETAVASIGDVMMQRLANAEEPVRMGNRGRGAAPEGCYRCRGDDRWVAITVADESDWQAFCGVLGNAEWLADPRFAGPAERRENADALDERIGAWTGEREAADIEAALQAAGVAAGVVQNVEDQFERDPQLADRGFFEELEHLTRGVVTANGIPFGLTETPARSGRTGAAVGEDNDYVFGELLGLSADEIRRYIDAGVIETGAN